MAWGDRMLELHGHPKSGDWCRALAYAVGEAGNDYPSDNALLKAQEWEINGIPHQEIPVEE
jgi:hypothetical protein